MSASDPTRILADQAARDTARERFDVPILLEAGAGTGKTRALVERLLAWTLDRGWSDAEARPARRPSGPVRGAPEIAADVLDGVVAITFSEAAAAEMASRLTAALTAIARGEPSDEAEPVVRRLGIEVARARAETLTGQLGRARIQTIHAFCRALLASFPFEAGLHPSFRVDPDGERTEAIATEVLSAQLAERLGSGDPDWIGLLGEDLQPQDLLAAVLAAQRRGVRVEDLEHEPFTPERLSAVLRSARTALTPLAETLALAIPRLGARAKAHEIELRLRSLLDDLGSPAGFESLGSLAERAEQLVDELGATIRGWARGESVTMIERALEAEGSGFTERAARAWRGLQRLVGLDPEGLSRARRVIGEVLRESRLRARREGVVSFDELLLDAARLLAVRPDVLRTIRRGIRQLLVDEFQDTDARQCEVVSLLALEGPVEERPGLFVVGDPKQSIYGWRSADLAAYEAFVARAEAAGAVRGRLEVNFRSTPDILEEVERALGGAFDPEPGMQPPYQRLVASPEGERRGRERGDRPAVEYWVSVAPGAGRKTGSARASRIEARAIARDLLEQRAAGAAKAWSEVALLARSAGDLEIYLQALRESGIPFEVERDRSYWRRREIIDAAAAVRAIVEPGDHLALLTFLRSPFVGVPDAALLPLWRERLPERADALLEPDPEPLADLRALLGRVASGLPDDIPGIDDVAGWEESAFAALEALAELRSRFGRESAERFVERLRSRLVLEPLAAARFLGRFGLANLERFLRDLERALEAGGDDPASVVRFLRKAVTERREAEEARPPESGADAVRVMTIHRAKGLEFGQVYLVQAHKGRGRDPGEPPFDLHRDSDRDGSIDFTLLGLRTPGWAEALERRGAVAEREQVRLLYVALTRARDRLVVAGQFFATRSREGSFLPLIEARVEQGPARDGSAGELAPLPERDATGTLWRAPACEPGWRETADATDAPDRPGPDDPSGLARRLDEMTERRREASERATRALVARASELAGGPGLPIGSDSAPRRLARARGVGLHRALECAATGDARAAAALAFATAHPAATMPEHEAFATALDALECGRLWRRLLELEPRVVARELPLLVAAPPDAGDRAEAIVGTLDLLYRDPESNALVVADFKSDAVEDDAALAGLVERYRPQLEAYGRAVRGAAGTGAAVRLELWLLSLDRIVPVSPGPDGKSG